MAGEQAAREDLERSEQDPHFDAEVDEQSAGERAPAESTSTFRRRWTGFAAGLVLAALVYLALPADLAHPAKVTAAIAVLMGLWWMTEAIPIPATALLPLVVFPLLVDDVSVSDVGAYYGDPIGIIRRVIDENDLVLCPLACIHQILPAATPNRRGDHR